MLVQYTSRWNGSRVAFTAETWERGTDRLVCHGRRTLAGIEMGPVIKVDLAETPEITESLDGARLTEEHAETS